MTLVVSQWGLDFCTGSPMLLSSLKATAAEREDYEKAASDSKGVRLLGFSTTSEVRKWGSTPDTGTIILGCPAYPGEHNTYPSTATPQASAATAESLPVICSIKDSMLSVDL